MGLTDIMVVGPTASGKTCRAVQLARSYGGEVISCDSRQVYKKMTLGTGKDLGEYEEIPYHLIDICEAGEKYNLHRFLKDYSHAEQLVHDKGKRVVACGGSGMYAEAVANGLKLVDVPVNEQLRNQLADRSLEELTEVLKSYKRLHNTTDIDTCKRAIRAIEIEEFYSRHPEANDSRQLGKSEKRDMLIIGVDIPREKRRERISDRLVSRLKAGMVEEVEGLLKEGISPDDLIYYGLEYKFLTLYLTGRLTYEDMVRDLEIAIHQFAKRQMTWFRGMEKRGHKIHWLPYDMVADEFVGEVGKLLMKS